MKKINKLSHQISKLLFVKENLNTKSTKSLEHCMLELLDICENDQHILQMLLNLEADVNFPPITSDFGVELLRKACSRNFVGTLIFLVRKCSTHEVLESSGIIQEAFVNGRSEISVHFCRNIKMSTKEHVTRANIVNYWDT